MNPLRDPIREENQVGTYANDTLTYLRNILLNFVDVAENIITGIGKILLGIGEVVVNLGLITLYPIFLLLRIPWLWKISRNIYGILGTRWTYFIHRSYHNYQTLKQFRDIITKHMQAYTRGGREYSYNRILQAIDRELKKFSPPTDA